MTHLLSSRIGERLEAKPIACIVDQRTKEIVGWLYVWNTGQRVPRWIRKPRKDVFYIAV